MLAALGILAGEAVEGSSFLFDAQITGPAIDHFAQVCDSSHERLLYTSQQHSTAQFQPISIPDILTSQ